MNTAVAIISGALYFDKPAKIVNPETPRPRDANMIPPLQHRDAAREVKTGIMLISLLPIVYLFNATPPGRMNLCTPMGYINYYIIFI